jgi:4-carboxymuconolactone decarboxylase
MKTGLKWLTVLLLIVLPAVRSFGQEGNKKIVRLAKLVIDAAQLDQYNALLREGIETAVKVEPGVLTIYAVAEKNSPTHITILEIYASEEAYRKHIQSPHFLKYKNETKNMVISLELVDTVPLIPEMKIK